MSLDSHIIVYTLISLFMIVSFSIGIIGAFIGLRKKAGSLSYNVGIVSAVGAILTFVIPGIGAMISLIAGSLSIAWR